MHIKKIVGVYYLDSNLRPRTNSENGREWPRMAENGREWPRMDIFLPVGGVPRIAENGREWPRMAENGREWPRMGNPGGNNTLFFSRATLRNTYAVPMLLRIFLLIMFAFPSAVQGSHTFWDHFHSR